MRVMSAQLKPAAPVRTVIIPSPRIGIVALLAGTWSGARRLGRWWWRRWQDYMEAGGSGGSSEAPRPDARAPKAAA